MIRQGAQTTDVHLVEFRSGISQFDEPILNTNLERSLAVDVIVEIVLRSRPGMPETQVLIPGKDAPFLRSVGVAVHVIIFVPEIPVEDQ